MDEWACRGPDRKMMIDKAYINRKVYKPFVVSKCFKGLPEHFLGYVVITFSLVYDKIIVQVQPVIINMLDLSKDGFSRVIRGYATPRLAVETV